MEHAQDAEDVEHAEDAEHAGAGVRRLDRRSFLRGGSVGVAGALLLQAGVWQIEPAVAAPKNKLQPGQGNKGGGELPSFTTTLRRREDQLRLRFEFYNLRLDKNGPGDPVVVAKKPNQPVQVVVEFLPQHVMEEALYEYDPDTQDDVAPSPGQDDPDPTSSDPVALPPIGSRVSGVSRLAFTVPPAALPITYTSTGLLDWSAWTPRVVPVARRPAAVDPIDPDIRPPQLEAPGPLDTAIELPWWLLISPDADAGWDHVSAPVGHGPDDVTELWHTRLVGGGTRADEATRRTIRAIWARDPHFSLYLEQPNLVQPPDGEDFPGFGIPFRTPLSPRDRYDLVVSMGDFSHAIAMDDYVPTPADVDMLMLTALGGTLQAEGAWRAGNQLPGESGTSLQSWRHDATGGRDHYVRVVRKGYLFPFGHGASLIKVSERRFETVPGIRGGGRRIAYVFQRYFLVVRQRVRDYGIPGLHQHDGRAFPFTRLRLTTLVTPNLDPPLGVAGLGNTLAFVPEVGGNPFAFDAIGTDRAGRSTDLAVPVVFVDATIAFESDQMQDLRDAYNDVIGTSTFFGVEGPVRRVDAGGAPIAVAPPDEPGDTTLEVRSLSWGVEEPEPGATQLQLAEADQPRFLPTMAQADIRLAGAEVALGGGLGSASTVVFDPEYVTGGFTHPGEVFVRLKDWENWTGLDFGATAAGDRAGGVVTPNIGITGLSRRTGTIGGDPATFQGGTFDPGDFFGALDATLLGGLSLQQVVDDVTGAEFDLSPGSETRDLVVRLVTREQPDAIVTELRWLPRLRNVPDPDGELFTAELGGTPATLDLRATITVPRGDQSAATFSIVGDLRSFQLGLLPGARFILIGFDRVRFRTATGTKPDVDVDIRLVAFDGPLRFVEKFKKYLAFGAGGFAITALPDQVRADFELPIPSIEVGVFSLQNITFAAAVNVPFTGDPIRTRFSLSTQENPFLLSVMIFGGGGFFELALGPDGVEGFQAGLEFGGSIALDVGVASGSIRLTAGIYLAIGVEKPPDNPDGAAEMTGFLKLKGQLQVMGMVSVSLLMKASITYLPGPDKAVAQASVVLEVDVPLVSVTVEIDYEKRFGGSNDPTFGQTLPQPAMWDAYCDAFAPIGA